ncbi:hypothetical protein HMPREF1210_01560 [Paenisporosarcina sp. HGH0030]|nr:hypothetical protein HMPREF1210_01560 [Paenisporosarcina sp. HGH0030]
MEKSAKRFLKKALAFSFVARPRVKTIDKNQLIQERSKLKNENKMQETLQIIQIKYLNNIVEQDH